MPAISPQAMTPCWFLSRSLRHLWRPSAVPTGSPAVLHYGARRQRLGLRPAAAGVLLASLAASPAMTAESDLPSRIGERLDSLRQELIEVRRDIHRHPEISGEEERTAGVVAQRLRDLGFDVRTGVGGHGVVGVLRGGRPGPVVAFRSDMDAVPSNAPDPVDFRSLDPGKRHICGHDLHTTIGLALAEGFAAVREDLPGTIQLIFQPAEENATGARAMLADGVFVETRPAAIYAVHTAPLEIGQIATAPGGMMAGRDQVTVTVSGSGDIEAAAKRVRQEIQAVGTLSAAQAMQPQQGDFSFVQIRPPQRDADTGDWIVNGVVTTATSHASEKAARDIAERLEALPRDGVEIEHRYQERVIAGVTNDPDLTARASASAKGVLGESSVVILASVVPLFSEDFGSFQEEVPGVMFFLGVSNSEKGWVGMPHSPGYVADEEAIFIGARTMSAVILDRLTTR